MLGLFRNRVTKMLYAVTLQAKCYYIMCSDICYIIDWGFHIIAMDLYNAFLGLKVALH